MALNNQLNQNGEQTLKSQPGRNPPVPLKPTKLQQPKSGASSDLIKLNAKPPVPPKSVSDKRLSNCEAALQALSNVIKNCPGKHCQDSL